MMTLGKHVRLALAMTLAMTLAACMTTAPTRGASVPWVDSFRDLAPAAIEPVHAPFAMPQPRRPVFPDRTFNIRDFGAVEANTAVNTTANTAAIARAIAAASKAGGGTVLVPAGRWLTGPIHLESNINLHLDKDATVLFSQNFADYRPGVFCRHEGIECIKYSPFIYANGATNIAVTGQGVLDGQGDPWWRLPGQDAANRLLRRMGEDGTPLARRVFDGTTADGGLRPAFFEPVNCKNVLVEGVEFRFGAFWTITPCYCENVIVRGVKVKTWESAERKTPNGDGVDPDSCRNVLIEYCDLDTGDDCIAIKSGKDRDGLAVARPTENLVVRKIRAWRGHGGISIGSEVSGGVRNVYGYDCVFDGTDRGMRFKTGRGRGGVIENVWCENIAMGEVAHEAIHLTMLYVGGRLPAQQVGPGTPSMRNLHFKNISCKNAKGNMIQVTGLPERPIENVTIENCAIGGQRPVLIDDAKGVTLRNVKLAPARLPAFDILDSWKLRLTRVDVAAPPVASQARPAMNQAKPTSTSMPNAAEAVALLDVKGKATRDVVISGGNLAAMAGKPSFAVFGDGASKACLKVVR
jgi:polygalacturonase